MNRRQGNVLPRREFLNEQGLGACYQSTAVVPDGTAPAAVDDPVTNYVPSARPGHRAPLVRPDGHVAWRSRSAAPDPAAALRAAFDRVFGRVPATA
jgi:aromatic ring hydroxylase-like protein